ncbi:MAG: PAS domain-containing sensor histidine kinase [Anaerolineae bacterium]|nr:PAS domain-containing sensor histidine kinase [Anaerolineae bacterium]
MSIGWWILAALLVIIIGQIVFYWPLKKQLRRAEARSLKLERKLAFVRQELAEAQIRRKKLLSASTQALIIVEKDYRISSANKVARRLFGPVDKTDTFTTWTRQHQLRELVDQTLQGEKMPSIYFTKDDRTFEVQARSIKGRSIAGKKEPVAVALAIHDVTELQRLSRARRDFVTNISHELRTPLASLRLLTETLLNGALNEPDMAVNLVNKMAAQLDTLNQLAQELLDLSLIESGQAPLKLAAYPLRAIVQAQVDQLLPQAERKNLSLQLDIAEDLKVLADETMIGRVITNLIHNSIKFTETGVVTISAQKISGGDIAAAETSTAEDWVQVRVADTGLGIPPDELNRIFERFYKIDRARNRKQSGTGLGLAIAKHIVEAHGGRIWAESNGKNGTTFYFTLPPEE